GLAEPRQHRAQGLYHVDPESRGIVVADVQREPCHRVFFGLRRLPLRYEHRLPATRRAVHERERERQAPRECLDQVPADDTGRTAGSLELRLEERSDRIGSGELSTGLHPDEPSRASAAERVPVGLETISASAATALSRHRPATPRRYATRTVPRAARASRA